MAAFLRHRTRLVEACREWPLRVWIVASLVALGCSAKADGASIAQANDQKAHGCAHTRTWREARKLGYVDDIPRDLVEALQAGTCVAMVGAGLSAPAKLPGYEALLRTVANEAKIELRLLDSGSYDDLDRLQFQLAKEVGKEKMCTIMRSKLYLQPPLPRAMQAVLDPFCRLPFASVVSWNWDNILDPIYPLVPNNSSGFSKVLAARALPSASYKPSSVPLLKMQGVLDDVASVFLTRADYERRDAGDFLRRLHETRTVLYIGMSLRSGGVGDQRRAGARHYAIINDVTPERRQQLLKQNIHAISYGSEATAWKGSQIIMGELSACVDQMSS